MEKRVREFERERHGLRVSGRLPLETLPRKELGREIGVLNWYPEIGLVEVVCPICFEAVGVECGTRAEREILDVKCCGGVFVLGAV